MTTILPRRLPAYGRTIRDALDSGMRPVLGNTIAVCIDWPERCVLAHVVCVPSERPPKAYDYSFLAGVDTIVWFRGLHSAYADQVRELLTAAGSPVVAMLQVPEALE